ncbi:MAG: hypothetical protein M3374_01085 [Pseudomonadota bacterium]|nr:hypothetical protein [Pseudomonadota bacterium]
MLALLRPSLAALAVTVMTTALLACKPAGHDDDPAARTPPPMPVVSCDADRHGALLVPASGVWFGVSLDLAKDSPVRYSERLGRHPAVYVSFSPVPIDSVMGGMLDQKVEMLVQSGGMLLLTLEPRAGLDSITPAVAESVAARLAQYNSRGVMVLLRFAHEMNGSWYVWSQQPARYIAAFRRVADAVHRLAPGTAMLWAPNYGGGYPFRDGKFQARPGSADMQALDTDDDGELTANDDPYAPYYPGDDAVDWSGMSLYHWGAAYPWGSNDLPEPEKFARMLEGGYHGSVGDERHLPNFYRDYGERRNKPVGVFETAAFYAPASGGADEMALKSSWWRQVYAPAIIERFPHLKMINWFEWDKHEVEVAARVDWGVTVDTQLRAAYREALPDWLRFAEDVDFCR